MECEIVFRAKTFLSYLKLSLMVRKLLSTSQVWIFVTQDKPLLSLYRFSPQTHHQTDLETSQTAHHEVQSRPSSHSQPRHSNSRK